MKNRNFRVGDRVFVSGLGWCDIDELKEDTALLLVGEKTFEIPYPLISFKFYEVSGVAQERPIDYEQYKGKFGLFFDDEMDNVFVIAKLGYYCTDDTPEFETISGDRYLKFVPISEEQVKHIGITKILEDYHKENGY